MTKYMKPREIKRRSKMSNRFLRKSKIQILFAELSHVEACRIYFASVFAVFILVVIFALILFQEAILNFKIHYESLSIAHAIKRAYFNL